MNRRWILLLVTAVVLALACVSIAGCGTTEESAEPTATPVPCPEPKPIGDELNLCGPDMEVAHPFFAPAQVIVGGPADQIDEVLKAVAADVGLQFVPLTQQCLTYVDALWGNCNVAPFNLPGAGGDDYVMRLYEVRGCPTLGTDSPLTVYLLGLFEPVPTAEVAALLGINKFAQSKGRMVAADLSYDVSAPIAGSQWSGAGSPYMYDPKPWSCDEDDAKTAFEGQWVWDPAPGINLPPTPITAAAKRKVRVGVFDTWPSEMKEVDWDLTVHRPKFPYARPVTPDHSPVPEHGVFVAGMVNLVAPESEIHVYRVLDDYARGDLSVLNTSLVSYTQEVIASQSARELDGAVINLSLGIRLPQDVLELQARRAELADVPPKPSAFGGHGQLRWCQGRPSDTQAPAGSGQVLGDCDLRSLRERIGSRRHQAGSTAGLVGRHSALRRCHQRGLWRVLLLQRGNAARAGR